MKLSRTKAKQMASRIRRHALNNGWKIVRDYVSRTSTSRYLTLRRGKSQISIRMSDHDPRSPVDGRVEIRTSDDIAQLIRRLKG